jgi:hypothetical protein
MEKISRQEDHIDIPFLGQTHYFVETLPAIVAANWITLVVADMVIRGDENPDSFCIYRASVSC